jgi:hypothetical protein
MEPHFLISPHKTDGLLNRLKPTYVLLLRHEERLVIQNRTFI